MDLKKLFSTNQEAEVQGVWHDLGEGAKIKVARLGNPKNRKILKELTEPYRTLINRGKLSDEIWTKLTIEAMAKTILLDFEGIQVDGKDLEYSVENAVQLLTELPDFREYVMGVSNDMAVFQAQEEAEEVKN